MKNKPTEKVQSNVPVNKPLNQLKGQSYKYSFVYLRRWSVFVHLFKLGLIAAPFFLVALALPPGSNAMLMGTVIIAFWIGFFIIPMPKSYGYGTLHENHVEIRLYKEKYLIEYHKIAIVQMRKISINYGPVCLIVAETAPYIDIVPYSYIFDKKITKHSTKAIRSFQKALERKVNEVGGSKSKKTKLIKNILR